MNDIPPIPPGYPEFQRDDLLGWFFELPGKQRVFLQGFDDASRLPNCRKHISYFARCAWIDLELDDSNPDYIEWKKGDHKRHKDWREWYGFTEFNALKWRLWEKQK